MAHVHPRSIPARSVPSDPRCAFHPGGLWQGRDTRLLGLEAQAADEETRSLGPRGSKLTFSRRGTRQTIGIPGTGLFPSRQLSGGSSVVASQPDVGSSGAAVLDLDPSQTAAFSASPPPDEIVVYYGFTTVVGVVFGLVLLLVGLPSSQALIGGGLAIVAGIVYEGLAHHHPGPAKALAQIVVGLASLLAVIAEAILVVTLGATLAGAASSRRRRR